MAELPNVAYFAAFRAAISSQPITQVLSEGPRNISQLVESTRMDRSTLCHCLNQLEKHGLIHSKYRIITTPSEDVKGIARKEYYRNEEKIEAVKQTIEDVISYLRGCSQEARC